MGDRGKVTPGDPNTLRSCAGTSCSQLGSIPAGGEFDVLGGPSCNDSYWWWRVRYNGTTGWTAEGDNSNYWLMRVGGSSSSESNSPQLESDLVIKVYSNHWNEDYYLSVNPRTCAITNGAEILAQEIGNFNSGIGQLSRDNLKLDEFVSYFSVNNGATEQFRLKVESEIKKDTDCYTIFYLVGKQTMDTSGIGNVVFGFAMQKWPWLAEEAIADITQAMNDNSRGWPWDNSDDRKQRELGREIANQGSHSAGTIGRIAEDINLF